jgi:hypothetical protein
MSDDTRTAELLWKAIAKPDHYDGNRAKFADWWADMRLYLQGFTGLSHEAKIIMTLGLLTKGDAATWACIKKEGSFDLFSADLEAHISDPICAQKALNEIHNFTQG